MEKRRQPLANQPRRKEKNVSETATARVTGYVLKVDVRSGTSRATNEPYSMTIVRVLVANTGVTELILPRDFRRVPTPGEEIDYLVEFSGRGNGQLGSSVVGEWPVAAVAA
jgi:hypothetical protein